MIAYKNKIEGELTEKCSEILKLLEEYVIPKTHTEEATVFFLKMKADYYRYIAEFNTGEQRSAASQRALLTYTQAVERANKTLSSTHPVKLGLALNYAVFFHEIMMSHERAIVIARDAFNAAIIEIDSKKD